MATSAARAGDGSKDPAGNTPQAPARISKKTIENAKSAASTAVDVLGVVAEMAENVPYLGAVSKALTTFKEVLEEVDVCKKDCRAAASEAAEFVDLMNDFEAEAVPSAGGKEGELRKACQELGSALLKCLETLQALGVDSKRKRDRLKLLLKRSDVQSSVSECCDKMRIAKEKFNMKMNYDTNKKVSDLHLRSQPTIAPQDPTLVAQASIWRLREANHIFYGRESEVEAAVDLILNKAPARVAILGPGGIGKTSIAFAILHHGSVQARYTDRRCFMSCEATTSSDAVLRALADALGFTLDSNLSFESARHSLMRYLAERSGIICLDNLETPLDADKRAVEDLLRGIAALPSIALLVTSRDTSIPTLKWTSPRLEHIKPFSREAALATWNDICDIHDDYTEKLIEAVDCMPLAVTLLARLASIEQSTKLVWDRWEAERTDMIRDGNQEDRLYSVSASIELSLRDHADAAALLGIICIFPDGLRDDTIALLDKGLKDRRESIASCLTLLKRLSLVYTEAAWWETPIQRIRVLSPIRHHVQQHHVSDELFLKLADIAMQNRGDWHFEYGTIVTFGWSRPVCHERCIQMAILYPFGTANIEVLSQAIEKARELELQIQSELHRQLGYVLENVHEFEKARSSFSQAIELDEQVGDRQALFKGWRWWIETFRLEFGDREVECKHLDEVQNAIQKAWELGCDESGVWDQGYYYGYSNLAYAQHFVNEGRRKLHMPIVHRSGLYSGNDSTVFLDDGDFKPAYDQLVATSSPPWDLSLILETFETLHRAREEPTSRKGSPVPFEGS
ncbi:hypothetical protein PENSPDRAFT_760458 [Peniophora sp. CONT]|nr:hypothetical protein PENSPDRAFT_760458 [Peniophora sp. CONT]